MTYDIEIIKQNDFRIRLKGSRAYVWAISDALKFLVPNAKYNPKVKAKTWDGYIRLIDVDFCTSPIGLLPEILRVCSERGYSCNVDPALIPDNHNLTMERLEEWILQNPVYKFDKTEQIYKQIFPYPYQKLALLNILKYQRLTLKSATSSGKSLIIFLYIKFILQNDSSVKNILLAVPTVNLVNQMLYDFNDYDAAQGFVNEFCCGIYSGNYTNEDLSKRIHISCWQSLQNKDEKFFKDYNVFICDEAHTMQGKELQLISSKLVNSKYRLGTSGTIKDSANIDLQIKAHFGNIFEAKTAVELINEKYATPLSINCVVLDYPQSYRKQCARMNYFEEVSYIESLEIKWDKVQNLLTNIEGNAIIFINKIDNCCEKLYAQFSKNIPNKKIFMIHGKIKTDERERIRLELDTISNGVVVASYKTFATGINIPSLKHLIIGESTKSEILIPQMAGRSMRLNENKNIAYVWDVVDDLCTKSKKNYFYRHFEERLELYQKMGFTPNFYKITLDNDEDVW